MGATLILLLILQPFLPAYCQSTLSIEQNDDGKTFRMTVEQSNYEYGSLIPVKVEIANNSSVSFLINDTNAIKEGITYYEKPTSICMFFNSEDAKAKLLVESGKTISCIVILDTRNLTLDKKYNQVPLAMKISYFTFVDGSKDQAEDNFVDLSSLNLLIKKE
jgi:hypothetical protein